MIFRAFALLLLAAPLAAPQASDDWLSAKEWWGQIIYEVKEEGSDSDTEWKLAERIVIDVDLSMATASLAMPWPGKIAPMDALQRGRFQSWTVRPTPAAWGNAWISGEGAVKTGTPGNGTTIEKTRSGTMVLGAHTTVQVDVKSGLYGFYVSAPLFLRDPEVKTMEQTTVESGGSSRRSTRWTTQPVVGAKANPPEGDSVRANGTSLFVWDQKLPQKVSALQGSINVPMKGKGTATGTLSWKLTPDPPPPIELELEAKGDWGARWEDWRPYGGADEKTPGSFVTLTARLVCPGALPDKPHYFRIELKDVSRERGVCLNYPLKPEDDPPLDFSFRKIDNPDPGFLVTERAVWTVSATGPEFKTKLACFDFGAWGEVTAVAILESGRSLFAHVKGAPSERSLRLPDRRPDSKIASVWKSPGPDDADDEDQPVGDGQKGDGLTNYEEYRGFRVNRNWTTGDPTKKEVFIRNEAGATAEPGITLLQTITDLKVHRLGSDELSKERVLNFNHTEAPHKVDQHGIRIVWEPSLGNACKAYTADGNPGLPKDVSRVGLGTIPNVKVQADTGSGGQKPMLYAAPSVAHELLHCFNVYHHGEDGKRLLPTPWVRTSPGVVQEGPTVVEVYDESGVRMESSLPFAAGSNLLFVNVRMYQGVASGDTSCVMRYDDAEAYIPQGAPPTKRVYIQSPPEVVGGSLCTSRVATGTNVAPGRFGGPNPVRGDCAHQFVVSDAATRTPR